ncbi:glycosyltransferase family 2 protein [Myroides odoratimimus]|uniref:glycosyltransferase family 2 protein n=1 Tax=Myroides odoratimimus TaxID=76832 RepID=UPI002574A78C|nr:glycosyltransferase family 2 protein [Myroides odoratimimus]MDM1033761.1 glycosyltransferase family 2 protein [Myroides odoratimimus]
MKTYEKPLVSVVMITYNHEHFIREAIESILNQDVNFEFELVLSNDNSTDSTDMIIRDIIFNHKKGSLIRYFNHDTNLGMSPNFVFSLSQARGVYIAFCEGDDYWIKKDKLQLQVDFLRRNKDFSLCCGGFVDSNNQISNYASKKDLGYEFSLKEHFQRWTVKSLTLCFRNDKQLVLYLKQFSMARDIHLVFYLLERGKGFYFNALLGMYNIHVGGVVSKKSKRELVSISYKVFKEFSRLEKHYLVQDKFFGFATLNLKYNYHFHLRDFKYFSIKKSIYFFKLILKG